MDKNKIIEIAFETIKESTDWERTWENKEYNSWIDGVIQMASNLIDEVDRKKY